MLFRSLEDAAAEGSLGVDLVLMDLNMPVLDGWEATRRLRSNPRFDGLPVLAMTAHALVEERERCLTLGMQDHLTKPIEPARLYGALARWGKRPIDPLPPAAPPEASAAPQLSGFDLNGALRRTAGNMALYRQLLASLARTQADAAERVEDSLGAGDRGTARQIVHTVKGVAANLGATGLAEAASRLENTLQSGRPADADLALFRHSLDDTVAQIHALPPLGRQGAASSASSLDTPDQGAAATVNATDQPDGASDPLHRLSELLRAGEAEAIEFFQAHRERLAGRLGAGRLAVLESRLACFDFEAAARELRAAATPAADQAPQGSGDPA